MTKIPLFQVRMSSEVLSHVEETIRSGTVTEGPRVLLFEELLSRVLGGPVLSLNSATSGLHLAAVLLDLQPGDEVISTPITCIATNLALLHAGARIVWADVVPNTGLIAPGDVAKKVTERTRAVVAVDWGGAVCDVESLRDASGGLPLIEDAAHAFGADRRERQFPDLACWSFQAIKHLTTGDGGALYVRDPELRQRARRLRWFGIDRLLPGPNIDKSVVEAGFKYHMNDLTASIGIANIEVALDSVARHRKNAAWYNRELRDVPGIRLLPADASSAWWIYTLILEAPGQQRAFVDFMASCGVECSRVHTRNDTQPVFQACRHGSLPGVDYFDAHQIAIPVGWWIGTEELSRVAEALHAWSRKVR